MMSSMKNDNAPLYARIASALATNIATGGLVPGSQLPPEDELAQRFSVSRTTVRKAVESLVADGLIEIQRGRGTFVSEPKVRQELTELSGFVEDMAALGRVPTARLLDKRLVTADKIVAKRLNVLPGEQVYRIKRVRLADGVPMSFDETYLPLEIGQKIVTNDLEAEPIFALLEEKYGIPLVEAEYQLEAVIANGEVATALGISVGNAIFLIERTSFAEGYGPVDYEKLYYRGDLIKFVTRLERRTRVRP